MQEGRIVDATASRWKYETQVSIILDANRKSDVRRLPTGKKGLDCLVEDIGIPTNILSRMTYIAEIPRDVVAQLYVSDRMMRSTNVLDETEKLRLEQEIRYLKVYCALVRDEFRTVTISEELRNYIADRVNEVTSITKRRLVSRI